VGEKSEYVATHVSVARTDFAVAHTNLLSPIKVSPTQIYCSLYKSCCRSPSCRQCRPHKASPIQILLSPTKLSLTKYHPYKLAVTHTIELPFLRFRNVDSILVGDSKKTSCRCWWTLRRLMAIYSDQNCTLIAFPSISQTIPIYIKYPLKKVNNHDISVPAAKDVASGAAEPRIKPVA